MLEFKSWRDFRKFEQATKNQARYIHAPEVEAFLDTILQTTEKRLNNFA